MKYWAHFQAAGRRFQLGPFAKPEAAVHAALKHNPFPKARSLYTGYGEHSACFDLQWHDAEVREAMTEKQRS